MAVGAHPNEFECFRARAPNAAVRQVGHLPLDCLSEVYLHLLLLRARRHNTGLSLLVFPPSPRLATGALYDPLYPHSPP